MPNITFGDIWVLFLLMGGVIGVFFALGLRVKVLSITWRGGVGMALGSIIGPIIGNLVDPLWLSYIVTFSVITGLMGVFIAWGGYKVHELSLPKQ